MSELILSYAKVLSQHALNGGDFVLGIVGLGRIGLPLAVSFARKGVTVFGADKNRRLVQKIRQGKSPFYEPGLQDSLRSVATGKLHIGTSIAEAVRQADIVVVCVSTCTPESGSMELKELAHACSEIARNLRRGQLVVLRSTVPPGTTSNLVTRILEKYSGLKAGPEFGVAFCPERLSEGHALTEIVTIPHIVAGFDDRSADAAEALFRFLGGEIVRSPSIETAELAKIFDNVYRHVNIALANELAMTCDKLGIDMLQTIALSNTSPRTRIMRPGLTGGSCLTKDLMTLAYLRGRSWIEPSLILDAPKMSHHLTVHLLHLIEKALGEIGKKVEGSRITILGLAYKSGTDDLRRTPAKPLIDRLIKKHALVRAHDPYVSAECAKQSFPRVRFSTQILEAARGADCIVIATDHLEYERMDLRALARVVRMRAAFVDARCQFEPEAVANAGFVYRGIGRLRTSAKHEAR